MIIFQIFNLFSMLIPQSLKSILLLSIHWGFLVAQLTLMLAGVILDAALVLFTYFAYFISMPLLHLGYFLFILLSQLIGWLWKSLALILHLLTKLFQFSLKVIDTALHFSLQKLSILLCLAFEFVDLTVVFVTKVSNLLIFLRFQTDLHVFIVLLELFSALLHFQTKAFKLFS